MRNISKKSAFTSIALALGLIIPQATAPVTSYATVSSNDVVKLRILETTDLHVNMVNYDYFKDAETQKFGLAKTATLIKQARTEVKNSMLFDNGDLIQGNPLGDYVAKINPLKDGDTHPVFKAMNLLTYDAANIGNHEFNYGLDFLEMSLKGAKFPYVNANVYKDDKDNDPTNDQNYFTPYLILDKEVIDEAGKKHSIKVGVIGFVPPQIMQWDKKNLEGKVIAKDIVETAKKFIPEMKSKGADIIVAIPHSGVGSVTQEGLAENATYQLSKVEGINTILFGHSHTVFPSASWKSLNGVDITKGTINGVYSVMPGSWGDHLGQVDLVIEKQNGKWVVTDGQTVAKPIFDSAKNAPIVEVTPEIIEAVKHEHEGTINWVRSAVGKTTAPINSYFALVQDDPSIQIVTNAQKWYVEKYIQGSEFAGLPVLSAGAPFKAGGRGGVDYFTDVAAGEIAIKNAADLYLYPNTLQAVLLTGAEVKEWLEMSAGQFNQIDPTKKEEQSLVNTAFPSYNYDVIDGVTYEIDVTKSARYDLNGQVVNPGSHRIVNLKYNGNLIDPKQKFIVATNNYRASGGGKFPGLTGNNIIIQSPDENRQILINYIMEQKTINPSADQNWAFSPIKGDINVSFETSPTAQKYLSTLPNINYVEKLESGFGKYKIQFVKNVQFKDVPKEHWSYNYIHELASYGIVESNTEAMFEPNKAITRGEFVSMLVKSLGLKAKNPTSFTDVTDAQVSEVAAAFEAGITTGTSKTTFEPNKLITRSQMVTMLMRAYKVKNGDIPKATEKKFTDITTLSTESQNSITAAANLEFIQGYGATFNPGRTATRAQAAKVVYLLNK